MILEISEETGGVPARIAPLLESVAREACAAEGVAGVSAYLRIVDDGTIREINRERRGIDRATDVLSFPMVKYPAGRTAGQCPKRVRREYDPETGACFVGDFVISLPRAVEQAEEYGHSIEREMGYLTAHAMLHLFGYDHMTEEERRVMRGMEEKIMEKVSLTREVSDERLFDLASEALKMAYAPYSKYRVGTCILASDGRTFQGCNVENASYGATICAERNAACAAVMQGATRFEAIAVAGEFSEAWPCGVCRQVLNEFSDDMRVICGRAGGSFTVVPLKELLPRSFGAQEFVKAPKCGE